ncbi:hypothetical protein JZ968_06505 [Riemerella anatipestifer]|nr:hypothetical protein [Riemerella anatipestifer]
MQVYKDYRRGLHTVLNNYVPSNVIELYNKKKSWKYGYNSQFDMVVISKDGTIGEVLEINGLKIALPATPKHIRFDGLTNEFQKWKRYEVPKELSDFDKIYKDEENIDAKIQEVFNRHKAFIEADISRKFNGDWFMCDGNPMYISGYHYFFLQHYLLTGGNRYPDFREPQRDYFLFVEACFADERCLGSLLLKSRRSSFSTTSGSIVLCDSITRINGFYPIVSKKDDDAKTLFTKHIVKPFNSLPKHLQPQRVGEVTPKKELFFSAPKKKLTNNNKTDQSDGGLDTLITFYSTTIDAYDGTQVTISINDEIGKMKGNLDINEFWDQAHKMCHIVGSEVVGKALCGSTANPPHQGGKNYEKFYNDSRISTRDNTGFTGTGLYAIFIPADFTTMGFFDQWGYAVYNDPKEPILNELGNYISIGSKSFLDAQEAACGDNVKKYNSQKRNNPRVDTDPFLDENASNMYATTGMVNTTNFLKANKDSSEVKQATFRFNLYYKDEKNGIVEMKRCTDGKFISVSPLPVPKEFRNKHKMKNNKKAPGNAHLGAFGCDPYQADRTKYSDSSKQGFVGMTTDHFELPEFLKNKTFLYYNHRADTRDEAEEDIIKAILYFSMPILPEINKKSLVKKLYERDLRNFVLFNPVKTKKELTPDELKYGGIYSSNSGNSIPEQESALETYVNSYFNEEISHIEEIKCPFVELNDQAASYTRQNRGSKDAVVAWMLACLAVNRKFKKPEPISVETTNIVDIEALFVNENLT